MTIVMTHGDMTKGFALDDERLKQGKTAFGKDYFKELLEREYAEFNKTQRIISDFDREVKRLMENGEKHE